MTENRVIGGPKRGSDIKMTIRILNPKQKKFTREYVLDHNATQAAIRAGYAKRSAKVTASRLLANDDVLAAIANIEADAVVRNEISLDKIIQKLGEIAYNDSQDTGHQIAALKELRKHLVVQGEFLTSTSQEADDGDDDNVRVVMYLPDNGRGPKSERVIKRICAPA